MGWSSFRIADLAAAREQITMLMAPAIEIEVSQHRIVPARPRARDGLDADQVRAIMDSGIESTVWDILCPTV